MPLGIWVIRTAESVVLTCWPPAPEDRMVSMRMSPAGMSISTSSASGSTATVAAEVWMRPCRFGFGHALHAVNAGFVFQPGIDARRPETWAVNSLIPPRSQACWSSTSNRQPMRSA